MDEKDLEVKTKVNEDGEEIIDESILEEKETQSESSTDEKPEESQEDIQETQEESVEPEDTEEESKETEEPEDVSNIPKEVEGETPRERALRKELERVRKINREKLKKDLLPTDKVEEVSEELLKDYNPEEIENFKKLAKAVGFVCKDELQTNQMSDVFDDFISEHPEYLPDRDKDDVLWKAFTEEFNLYKKPSTIKELKNLLERTHKQVIGLSSGKPLNKAAIEAKQTKIKSAAHGGGVTTTTEKNDSVLDSDLKKHLKGFSDDDLKELGF
jgi:hypothetical protein